MVQKGTRDESLLQNVTRDVTQLGWDANSGIVSVFSLAFR